eukprot:764299-Pelagomonas_calceolata.AAC.6
MMLQQWCALQVEGAEGHGIDASALDEKMQSLFECLFVQCLLKLECAPLEPIRRKNARISEN